jgi:hypothetical protein
LSKVEALTEADLQASEKWDWTAGEPLYEHVADETYDHYHEHIPAIRAWLDQHS